MTGSYSVIRTEKKFCVPPTRTAMIAASIGNVLHEDPHNCEDGYLVRSLYFDSIYDDDYIDKVNGTEIRKKIRLRTYDPDAGLCKLEIKQKQGAAQQKQSLIVSRAQAERLIRSDFSVLQEIDHPLAQQLYLTMELGTYRPRCIIDYRRTAFIERTNDTRITLDSRISVSKDFSRFFSTDLALTPVYTGTVLEVKYNGFLLSPVKKALDIADTTETAMSKYAMSREMLG